LSRNSNISKEQEKAVLLESREEGRAAGAESQEERGRI
jgi:hypothetical protein